MLHKGRLFSRIEAVADGDEFVGCNLAQSAPGTEIFAGKARLKFTRCNLARAIVPADSAIEDCNTSQMAVVAMPEPPERVEIDAAELASLRADLLEVREELKQLKQPKEVARG